MTFKDLARVIETSPVSNQSQLLKLRAKPFWFWLDGFRHKKANAIYKGACCFNHIIGPPKKNGIEKTFFDYEKELFKALMIPGYLNSSPKLPTADPTNIMYPFKEKHIWCKKSTGLGISEFFLRLMAWLALKDDEYKGSQMVIVTGPNIDLSIKLIRE